MGETKKNARNLARLRELGAELQHARQEAGLTLRGLTEKAGISAHSRISEAENGKRLLTLDELERILDALEIHDAGERERILGHARMAIEEPGQLNAGTTAGIDATLAQLIEHERAASRITDASPLMIPGLLQTSDYARAIMGEVSDSEMRVALRSGRRDILTRGRNPVQLVALIDSEALIRPVAAPDVMADQLRHVLRMADMPNVTVQVVSSAVPGYHPMLAGPFELIEFLKARPIVLLDHHRSSAFLWAEDDVAEFVEAAEQIKRVAMSPEISTKLITEIVTGMETTS
jgi:transcriptional regulator with XRE-family HTH domain